MAYKLGIVGIGHWFERLYAGILKTKHIELLNAASASGFEKKREQLSRINISQQNYFMIEPGKAIPDAFFDGIDIVHISDPNEFHAEQTLQSLSKGKITITEKTFGVNKEEHERIMDYIVKNHLENKAYLHLHYIHKLLTVYLPDMLEKFTREYGKITATSATFFEASSPEVAKRRLWLLSPRNGGLFLDWIHPFEIYYKGALADRMDLNDADTYVVNKEYGTENPTGIRAGISLVGRYFADGATGQIRISKGLHPDYQKKTVAFVFEGGQCLDLNFLSSEVEYITEQRGTWELKEKFDGDIIGGGCPRGPTSSDILVNYIVAMCNGINQGLTVDEIKRLYSPQWKYQEMTAGVHPTLDDSRVNNFIKDGLANRL